MVRSAATPRVSNHEAVPPRSGFSRTGKALVFVIATAKEFSERLLLVPALLAGEFHAGRALFSRNAIWRTAFSASSLDPGVALLHDNGFARHGLADQALGLLPHRLLGHPPAPV